MRILLDKQQFKTRPTGYDAAIITNRIKKCEVDLPITDIAQALASGQTWTPATFSGKQRNNANWEQQQIFALDFDSGITPEEVLFTLKDMRLQHSFFYTTFSDAPELRRFRVVFHLEEPITDDNLRENIQKTLMHVFNQTIDKKCKDGARQFYGGKQLLFEEYEPLNLDLVRELIIVYAIAHTSNKNNYDRTIARLQKSDVNFIDPYIYKGSKENTSKNDIFSEYTNNNNIEISTYTNVDINQLVLRVKILQDFVTGAPEGSDYWPDGYHKLFGIISNLQYIEGGLAWVKKVMDEKGYFKEHHYALLYVLKKYKYFPMNLSNFSQFEEDWMYTNILMATGKGEYELIRLDDEYPVISLQEAEQKLDREFMEALKSDSNTVTVIKTVTGLGKTRLLENLPTRVGNEIRRYTIAAPTHINPA